MLKKLPGIIAISFFAQLVQAQLSIIPQPVLARETGSGKFTINKQTSLVVNDPSLKPAADFFIGYLQSFYGIRLSLSQNSAANAISLSTKKIADKPAGAYSMEVGAKGIAINGSDAQGGFYGLQTLIQLLPVPDSASLAGNRQNAIKSLSAKLDIPYVTIEDHPRFAYRGMHLDVGRHFFPVSFVKRYIDYIALHKMNYFHWHLTEDQGWRIEIKKYPKLTTVGGSRHGTIIGRHPGTGNDYTVHRGYYTQDEVRDVVEYARQRYITVIPEIELPGHSSAAIAAYPRLSCFPEESTQPARGSVWAGDSTGKQVQQAWGVYADVFAPTEYTFGFLQDVLDEVMQLFPSEYIHIGGDECPKDNWKRSAFCQQLIREKGLKDEHGLQSYFIQRIEKYLNSKGRQIIGWDEILEGGLAPNATVMSWRGEQGGIDASRQGHDVIMTPGEYVYLDHAQSSHEDSLTIGGFGPVQKVYSYEPVPKELTPEEAKHVLGSQANVWTEYMAYPSKVEYMIFPRMSALSEVLWSPKELRNWENFEERLMKQFRLYDLWNVSYSKAVFDPTSSIQPQRRK